jgi:apolipoprotein N-acyltransferase
MSSKLQECYRTTFGHGLVGAAVLWAALPPLDLWPLAWVAPLWWVQLVRRRQLPGRRPYRSLWSVGFFFWLAAVHWARLAHWTAYFGWVALAFYLGFYLPVFIGLSRVAVHRLRVPVILAAPTVWAGLELARAHLLTGFTMASLAHTQYRWIALIQLSDLAGAYGVSFVVMLVAACLARMIRCEEKPAAVWPLVPAVAAIGAALVYGHLRGSGEYPTPQARIALIQGSVDTKIKFDPDERPRVFREYFQLSQQAVAKAGPKAVDLIVWPETMFRDTLITYDENPRMPEEFDGTQQQFRQTLRQCATEVRRAMAQLAQTLDTPLLLGVDRHHYGAKGVARYNSAVLVARSGKLLGYYDKMHLVVFGEYVPFVRHFPWLQRLTPVSISISPGTRPAVFELQGGLRIAPNICYETVIPHVIRRQVNALKAEGTEPDVLVNLTNDGWFRGSSELDMHLACGVFRAVECRKPLLIAANTGFSAFIDGDGRIRAKGPRRATSTILADVAPDRRGSWYLQHGDWPAGICLAGCVVLSLVAAWGRVGRKVAEDP